jgi:hypothetical protein
MRIAPDSGPISWQRFAKLAGKLRALRVLPSLPLGALTHFGLPHIGGVEKEQMRELEQRRDSNIKSACHFGGCANCLAQSSSKANSSIIGTGRRETFDKSFPSTVYSGGYCESPWSNDNSATSRSQEGQK